MLQSLTAEQLPLIKLLLHAAKHPSSSVSGLLLGSASDSAVTVSDVIPLFHNSTQLAMPTEMALTQVCCSYAVEPRSDSSTDLPTIPDVSRSRRTLSSPEAPRSWATITPTPGSKLRT